MNGKFLNDSDYDKILNDLERFVTHKSEPESSMRIGDYLNSCEAEYLPINTNFYSLLLLKIAEGIKKDRIFLALPRALSPKEKIYSDKERVLNKLNSVIEARISNAPEQEKPDLQSSIDLKPVKTFKWRKSDMALDILFLELRNEFISEDISLMDFKKCFSGVPQIIEKPIEWNEASNLLAYLLDRLAETKYIKDGELWSTAKNLFTKAKNLKQLKNNYLINKAGLPKNHKKIEKVLNGLQPFTGQ